MLKQIGFRVLCLKHVETKKCSRCKKELSLSNFHSQGSGRKCSCCSVCHNRDKSLTIKKRRMARHTDFNEFVYFMHVNIRKRINNVIKFIPDGKTNKDKYICSLNDFRRKALNDEKLRTLWENWKSSGYENLKIPSVDRIDSSRGYSIDNIQFITMYENSLKGNK